MHGSLSPKPLEGAEIQFDLDFDRYKALGGVNHHTLETFRKSPKRAKYEKENPAPPTPAMLEGEYLHAFMLEFEKARKEWGILSSAFDYRTKAGKDHKAEMIARYGERRVISEELWDRAVSIRLALINTPAGIVATESRDRRTEATCHWWDARVQITRKARQDCLLFEGEKECQPYDLKFVQDASLESFQRYCQRFGWHRQAAYYMEALHAVGIHAYEFRFVLIEKAAPYCIAEYILGPVTIQAAARENLTTLKAYAKSLRSDRWPDFYGQEGAEFVELPAWAFGPEEELYAGSL